MGYFTGSYGEGETGQYVEWLRDYCQAFFGLMVKLLPPVTTAAMVCAFRVNCSSRNLQIHTGERNHLMAYPGAWAFYQTNTNPIRWLLD